MEGVQKGVPFLVKNGKLKGKGLDLGAEQDAKKIIFTACHSGKLKLAFTSPDVISTSPKNFLNSTIDFTVLVLFEFVKKRHLCDTKIC